VRAAPPRCEGCYKGRVLDEPSLEFAATGVAGVLVLRALVLARGGDGLLRRRTRVESARARDLIGVILLAGAVLYAWRTQHATPWFLGASAVAILAQLIGFYFRAATRHEPADGPSVVIDEDEGEEQVACPMCGHDTLIELSDAARLLGGLSRHTPVSAVVCPECGALSGQVEDPARIPIGPEHGTTLQKSPRSEGHEALEEPAEHDG
jgi:hypothetical protein